MQPFRFLLTSFLLAILASVPLTAQNTSGQQLVDALLSCMLDGALARDDLRAIKLNGTLVGDSLATMTAHRLVIRRFSRCGATASGVAGDAEDVVIARNALLKMADILGGAFERALKFDEQILTLTTEKQVLAIVPEASKVNDDIDAAWRLYMPVAGIVAQVLVDSTKPNPKGQLDRLVLTRSQISKMRTELQEWFPNSIKTGDKHAVDAAAALLLKFLAQPWAAADEK